MPVKDEHEAIKIEQVLDDHMCFLFNENQIDDFSNAILVVMFNEEMQEWEDYYNDKEGMDWDEFKGLLEQV